MRPKVYRRIYLIIPGFLKLSLLISLCLAGLFIAKFLFIIDSVSCDFAGSDCPAAVLVELDKIKASNLLTLNKTDLTQKITSSSPLVARTNLEIFLPGKVHLSLEPSHTIAQISTSSSSASLLVSDSYQVESFSEHRLPDLHLIISPLGKDLRVASTITDPGLIGSLDLAQALSSRGNDFESIQPVSSDSAKVVLPDEVQVYFDLTQPISPQVRTLQLILSQTESQLSTIDLRYQKPIITFKL